MLRIKAIRESKNITQDQIVSLTGIPKRSYVDYENEKQDISLDRLRKIAIALDVTIGQLVGEYSTKNIADNLVNEERRPYSKLIPLYNDVSTIGGSKQIAELNPVSTTTEYIDAGDWFPGATAAIRHYDDSMIEYPSGSILALKRVNDKTQIVWGKNYCVETDEFRVSKKLQHREGDKNIWGYSTNLNTYPDGSFVHQPILINPDRINKLWLILGCVRKEYSSGVVFVQNGDK